VETSGLRQGLGVTSRRLLVCENPLRDASSDEGICQVLSLCASRVKRPCWLAEKKQPLAARRLPGSVRKAHGPPRRGFPPGQTGAPARRGPAPASAAALELFAFTQAACEVADNKPPPRKT